MNNHYPSPISSHLFISVDKKIVTFGGIDKFKNNYPIDVFKFDTITHQWTEEKFDINEGRTHYKPTKSRFQFSSCTYNKIIFIHGGLSFTKRELFNDLKILNQVSIIETNIMESKETKFKEWIVRRVIGSGTFGDVYKVSNSELPNDYFALKVLKSSKEKMKEDETETIVEDEKLSNDLREVLLQEKMNHKNILQIIDEFITKNTITKELNILF